MRQFFLFIFTLLLTFSAWSQDLAKEDKKKKARVATVEASEQIPVEDWMTQKQARMLALQKAKEKAIGDEFGWLIASERLSRRGSWQGGGEVGGNYRSEEVVVNRVKGYWVKTISEEFETFFDEKDKELWIRAKVKGKAKEIVEPPVNFEAYPLKCDDAAVCKSADFVNDESFYMHFVSPVDGYLAVYLALEESVQCLLPYPGMKDSFMGVNADEEYVLFSEPQSPEYFMYTEEEIEIDILTVIFSKTPFDKPILRDAKAELATTDDDTILPKELTTEEFYKWLAKLRNIKEDTQVKEMMVSIKKKA